MNTRKYNTTRSELQKRLVNQQPDRTEQAEQFRLLDNLNAFGVLEGVQRNPPKSQLCFGPRDVRGTRPDDRPWAGVVVWYRPPGYFNYRRITLLGIWIQTDEPERRLIIGTRVLAFEAPFYTPESYFQTMRTTFEQHYGTNAAPPAEANQLFNAPYLPEQRLQLRQQLEATIAQWRETRNAPQ